MPSYDHLTVVDEMFLHLEGPNTHMHVGGIALFEGPPPDYGDVLETVRGRLQLVPRFRQKLSFVPLGLGRPAWVDDPHFNLEYHVRHTALPFPADRAKLNHLTARIMGQQLDRSKPLWEVWLVEGLAGDRFAFVSKTHHCLVDGVSGADIMSLILDTETEPPRIAIEQWRPRPQPSPDELLVDALKELLTSPAEMVGKLQSAARGPGGLPARVVESARALGAFLGSSFAAPAVSLNQPVGPHRRFETVLADLNELKRIKNARGGTVNDVVLAVVSGGLRHLLEARGEQVDGLELRAMIPVSVRGAHEQGRLGNRIATMWAALPVYERDPIERLRILSDAMKDLKSSGQPVGAQVLTTLGQWAPPTVLAQAARVIARQRAFNLAITNVPGPQLPLYTLGREMVEFFPVAPLTDNTTLGVALLSYNGTMGIGLLGDYDTTPDLQDLAEGIEKSIAELLGSIDEGAGH
jgi:diacylglycerol O-acyltransferase / wax synthase